MARYAEEKLARLGRWSWLLPVATVSMICTAAPPLDQIMSGHFSPVTSTQTWALVAAGALALAMLGVFIWMIFLGLTNGLDNVYERVELVVQKVEELESEVSNLRSDVQAIRDEQAVAGFLSARSEVHS